MPRRGSAAFARARWLVVQGTGRRRRVTEWGCGDCPACRCREDAEAFAAVVGGDVVSAKEAA